jgi:hypothetical protein
MTSARRTMILAGAALAAGAAAVYLVRARRSPRPVHLPTAGRPLAVVRGELAGEG